MGKASVAWPKPRTMGLTTELKARAEEDLFFSAPTVTFSWRSMRWSILLFGFGLTPVSTGRKLIKILCCTLMITLRQTCFVETDTHRWGRMNNIRDQCPGAYSGFAKRCLVCQLPTSHGCGPPVQAGSVTALQSPLVAYQHPTGKPFILSK